MGRKESNQTNKNHVIAHFMYLLGQDTTCLYISIPVLTNFTSLYFLSWHIYLFFHDVIRADAFIKYIFSTAKLTVYLYEKIKKFQRNLSQLIYILKIVVI